MNHNFYGPKMERNDSRKYQDREKDRMEKKMYDKME